MKRFGPSRSTRLLIWTGAGLAWAAAFTAARLEPQRAANSTPVTPPATTEVTVPSALPSAPRGGLVILRYTPSEQEQPVRTVTVRRESPAPPPPPAPQPAPAPQSSGS